MFMRKLVIVLGLANAVALGACWDLYDMRAASRADVAAVLSFMPAEGQELRCEDQVPSAVLAATSTEFGVVAALQIAEQQAALGCRAPASLAGFASEARRVYLERRPAWFRPRTRDRGLNRGGAGHRRPSERL
jgi:hypothetical protein